MLPCLALAPELKLCILPSLRTAFSPHVGPNYAYSRHFCIYKPLYVQCASVHPGTTDVAEGTAAFHQDQLNKAVRYDDLDACIYLLRHYGAQGGLELSVPQLRKLASTSFNRHRPDAVLDVVRNIPKRHPKHYSVLMKECVKRRDLSALEKVIAAREAAGHAPDAYTATARLTALGAAGRASDVLTVLHEAWKVPSCRTIEVCNAAMGACASAGDCAMAEAVLSFLIDAGLAPDVVTYNSLIKAAGAAGMMAKVRGFYDDLRASGLVPTPLTYTSVFNAAAKNRHSDAVWLFQVFEEMTVEPNDFVLSSFFSAVSFAACSRSQLDSTFAILAEARARGPLNDTVYTANFMLLTRQGIPERAVDVWRAAQQDGAPMTPHLFSALFAACTAGNSPPLVDVAVDAYNDLREWWGAQDKSRVAAWLERDVLCAYNSLLHFVGQSGNLDEALGVFEDMKREGPLPDAVTYNTVIAAAAHVGDVDTALNVFLEMTNVGAAPTERTFGALLHAFAVVGDANAARKVFESVEAAGVKLNAVLYTSFIDALVKSGDDAALAQAFEVMEDMRRRRVPATAVTYGCLLSACEKLGNVDLAFKLYERACAEGVAPSDEMHDILISVCTAGGRLDEALDLVKSLARTHSTLQQGTLNSLVRALCSTAPSRALRMLSLMQTMGMQPTRRTYLALVTACAGSGEVLEAQALYRSMKAQGMEMDSAAGSALIACLCQAQKLSQAVAVYDEMMGAAWREEPAAPPTRKIPRKAALPKRAQVPDASALAFLAQAHAASGDLKSAWRFYKQLQRLGTGLQETVLTHRRLFEGLIEGFCRQKKVGRALIVFDDWKTASSAWFVQQSKLAAAEAKDAEGGAQGASAAGPPAPAGARLGRYPKLSNVSLAFLEACCRSEPDIEEWRIYDVCSVMRMQKDRKVQAGLARPQKASHHFLGNVQSN